MKMYSWLRALLAISSIAISCNTSLAQRPVSIQKEVAKKLKSIKPLDTEEYVYRVLVPKKPGRLPASLRLDLVYKIGHYQWDVFALRFEQKKGDPFVSVTQVTRGSALPFWKEATHVQDSSSVKHGQIPVKGFQKLLALANAFYHADIEAKDVEPPSRKREVLPDGSIVIHQRSYGVWIGSSGDGSILLRMAALQGNGPPIIRESGTLHAGDLKERVLSSYERVRVHLFWKVFYDYLKAHTFLIDTPLDNAGDLLVSRLGEPPLVDGYQDYFRQSLYADVLGEIGSLKAIPALESAAHNNKLEENWKDYLDQDISEAIEKIRARSKAKASATLR